MKTIERSPLSILTLALFLSAPALIGCDDEETTAPPEQATYRVTVTNMTGGLQPLTPSLVALHESGVSLLELGAAASPELERVAESGNNDPLTTMLQGMSSVASVGAAPGPNGPILPGEQGTVELSATTDMQLSLVSMLVCTNDGFTAVNGEALPQEVGGAVTVRIDAYDAGTERNTEASTDLVPPCVMATTGSSGGTGADQPEISESETIRAHPGVDGDTDGDDILDAQHQWTDPVAEVRVERIG